MKVVSFLYLLFALVGIYLLPNVSALPPGFVDEEVVRHEDGVNFEFIKYGNGTYHMLVATKSGKIELIKNPDDPEPTKQLVADISNRICDGGSRGLLGVTAHPQFDSKPWIYLFYTRITGGKCDTNRKTGPVNRFARYTLKNDGTLDLGSQLVMFETSRSSQTLHNGGKAQFGNDGMVWIMTGDGGLSSTPQDLGDLLGKTIRLTDDGQIPPDGNAFTKKNSKNVVRCGKSYGAPPPGFPKNAKCEEIWAYGFRNPFRFTLDPTVNDKTRFFVGDVGGFTWEEVSIVGTDTRGMNFGWPLREGPCVRNSATNCAPTGNRFQDPDYWYMHEGEIGPGGGGAISGVAGIPPGLWPEYDGRYLFAEYVFGRIHLLDPSDNGCRECETSPTPIPNYTNSTFHLVPKVANLEFGPHLHGKSQALYYSTLEKKHLSIRRIFFNGNFENRRPVAVLTPNVTHVDVGGWVNFDAGQSYDPDGDRLKYKFKVGREPFTKYSPSSIFSHKFEKEGKYRVKVRVQEKVGKGLKDRDVVVIVVGNLPRAEIISPSEGDEFAVGDVFTLKAEAVDYDGNKLPDESMMWEVRKHHNIHYHPYFDGEGNNLSIPAAPDPEDIYAATNSYLEVILTVTDQNNLKRVITRNVMPKVVAVDFNTIPSGLKLTVFNQDLEMPQRVSCWENQKLPVAPSANPGHEFESWSDGGARMHDIDIKEKAAQVPLYVAKFRKVD